MADGQVTTPEPVPAVVAADVGADAGEAAVTGAGGAASDGALQTFVQDNVYGTPATRAGGDVQQGQLSPQDGTGGLPTDGRSLPSGTSDKIRVIGSEIANGNTNRLGPKKGEPTEAERKEAIQRATDSLEKNPLFGLLSAADRELATKMQAAVMAGDTKALGEIVKSLAGQPEKLEALAKAITENLGKNGADTRLMPGPDGSMLVFSNGSANALQVGKDGTSKPVAIEQTKDGGLHILNDRTVVSPTGSQLAKQIGDSAVNATNWGGRFINHIEKIPMPPPIGRPYPGPGPFPTENLPPRTFPNKKFEGN